MPRLIAVRDNELLVVSFLGAAVLVAGIAELLGVTDAIGAFMTGLILGSTPLAARILPAPDDRISEPDKSPCGVAAQPAAPDAVPASSSDNAALP